MSLKLKPGKRYRLKFYEPGVYVFMVGWDEYGGAIGINSRGMIHRMDTCFNWRKYKEHKHGKSV